MTNEEMKKALKKPFWENDFWLNLLINYTIGIAMVLIIRDFIGKPQNIGAINPIWLDNALVSLYNSLGRAASRGADYTVPLALIFAFSRIGKLSWEIISDLFTRLIELLEAYILWRENNVV